MKKVSNSYRRVVFLMLLFILSGCATRSYYSKIGETFSTGYNKAGLIISESLRTAVRDARKLALVYYLNHDNTPYNLDTGNVEQSFMYYVCAGSHLYGKEFLALTVLGDYSRILKELSSEPPDEIGELWSSIHEQRAPDEPLRYDPPQDNAFQTCLKELKDKHMVKPEGVPITRAEVEVAPDVFSAYKQLGNIIDAVQDLIRAGLKAADDIQRAKALRKFVLDNEDTVAHLVGRVLENGTHIDGEIIKEQTLMTALELRKRASLVLPYYQFCHMMSLDRSTRKSEIVLLEARIHLAMKEFDVLRMQPDPGDVLKAMREAQTRLLKLARGELTAQQAWGSFLAFRNILESLYEPFGRVETTVRQL